MSEQLDKVSPPGSEERLRKLVQYWAASCFSDGLPNDDLEILIATIMQNFNRID